MTRIIKSPAYGNLPFYKIRQGFYKSESGQLYLLGAGNPGGKFNGLAYLDLMQKEIGGYQTAMALGLCNDFFGLPTQPVNSSRLFSLADLNSQKLKQLFNIMKEINLPPVLAIRSSAQVEDQPEMTAAGRFGTEFHGRTLDTEESRAEFITKLLMVINSAYSEEALEIWRKMGRTNIPPIGVILQTAVGSTWERMPNAFFPYLSGRIDTSFGFSNDMHKHSVSGFGAAMEETAGNEQDVFFYMDLADGTLRKLEEYLGVPSVRNEIKTIPGAVSSLPDELGKKFQEKTGFPVEIEWAWKKTEDTPHLLQIRPVKQQGLVKKPEDGKIIFSTPEVLGEREASPFDSVLLAYLSNSFSLMGALMDIARMGKTFPNNLLVIEMPVTGFTNTLFKRSKILKQFDVVVVKNNSLYAKGGISHFTRDLVENRKLLLYYDGERGKGNLIYTIQTTGEIQETIGIKNQFERDAGVVTRYKLPNPVYAAGSHAGGWGMIWQQ